MTYTQLAILGVLVAIVWDLWIGRTRLLTRQVFWMAYPIIVFFQLITNGMFTGFGVVQYDGDAIIGGTSDGVVWLGDFDPGSGALLSGNVLDNTDPACPCAGTWQPN